MTAQTLREWFTTFNAQYFGNTLPEPHFVVNHAKRTLGQFSCHKVRRGLLPGRWKTTGYTIKVSEFYHTSDHDRQSVLLHEMIHFYIAYTQTRDTSAHGKVFRQWMQRLMPTDGTSPSPLAMPCLPLFPLPTSNNISCLPSGCRTANVTSRWSILPIATTLSR